MKRVDHMIKYLSGELSAEEARVFKRELSENPRLKEDFSDVSAAYRLIGDQLRSADEKAFSETLKAAMQKSSSQASLPSRQRFRLSFLLMAVAASVAILISIFVIERGPEKIYASWYKPSGDPVILALNGHYRGEAGHQVLSELWKKEEFVQCRSEASKQLSEDSSDPFAMLFFLLSSMETEEVTAALDMLKTFETDSVQPFGQAIRWYQALALIRTGETQEAAALLATLGEHTGPYQKDADKLGKKLKK